MIIQGTFAPGDDGLYHCKEPGCPQPGYKMPQHLGLHRFHTHGIKGESRKKKSRPVSRPRKVNGPAPLAAADVCHAVLTELAPNGTIPIGAIGAYNEWVRQTEAFLAYLLG